MRKFFRNVFVFAFWSGLTFVGFKIYKKIKAVIMLDKTLPLYLGNVVEEKPKIKVNFAFKKLTLDVEFSKNTLDKNKDLETTIIDYINDFYPDLAKCTVQIKLVEANEVAETESAKEEKTEKKTEPKEKKEKEADQE